MNDQASMEAARKRLADDKAERERAARDAGVGEVDETKPTPTQEENDLAKMGATVMDKEEDGSDPEPPTIEQQFRNTRRLTQEVAPPQNASQQPQGATPQQGEAQQRAPRPRPAPPTPTT